MANFVSPFEKWGRRRCRFRPSWPYSLVPYTFHTYLMQEFQIIARNGFYNSVPARTARWSSSAFFPLFCLSKKTHHRISGIFLSKLFWPTVKKNCSSDREKLLKFEAEGREFAKFLRSLEQLIQTVKCQNNFW